MRYVFLTALFVAVGAFAQEPADKDAGFAELSRYYFAAARIGDTEVLREFSQAGFPLDLKNPKGYTALMIATYNGNEPAVDYLLERGADACVEDRRGNTALMAAIFRGEFSIARTLLKQDCDAARTNKAGHSAEDFARVFGRERVVQLLQQRRMAAEG
ncbi:ankyrin repeat domain-containing protein [Microbulbifer sp. 2205BS26-8]|uniref:ankyrin repeat domain-containing protein n=1 Tax=Microbulbifer sp. 2205BS26-8 TaxID=3064386 RepID=UPI00273EC2DC|nr:ankyrin repeat domain-containing protein [Microbulbifer sp. 2205BS26-8]MDP5208845.1 ankyrin repeat domain-containing protein [Microbulbifer sp. 2205BS26-8]